MLSRELAERCLEHAHTAAVSEAMRVAGNRYLVEGQDGDSEPRELDRVRDVVHAAQIAEAFFAEDTLRLSSRVIDTFENRVVCFFG